MEETQPEQVQEDKQEVQNTQQGEQVSEAPKQESSGDYTLQHDRPNCIGCAACEAVAPDVWEMNSDGKSDIKGGVDKDNGWQEIGIEEKDFQLNKDAADSCPVNVIHILKKDSKEKII
jgi:ferredoxin|tara:strand:- start:1553 stop:1906 length:354 start_codon:yes stop_codon:yes gene_type:complete